MTQHNPDHSVDGLQVPPEVRRPRLTPLAEAADPPQDPITFQRYRRPWWVCLLKFLVRLILRRKGG